MLTVTGILGVSAATLMAASSVVYLGKAELRPAVPAPRATTPIIQPSNVTLLNRAARTPAIHVKTRVLILKQSILDGQNLTFNATIPGKHVRPDTDFTDNGVTIIDDETLQRLLKDAQSDPSTHDFKPEPLELTDGEDEFDCLSEPYRDPPKYLPPELSSALINGLSMQYVAKVSSDRHNVIFSPILVDRADLSHEVYDKIAPKTDFKQKYPGNVTVPSGRTLVIDAGPIKAKPTQTTPSHHMIVLMQPTIGVPTK